MKNLWIAFAFMAAACNNTTNDDTAANNVEDDTTTSTATPITDTVCYLAVQNRDSILLQLQIKDSAITGLMQYDNFEIDGNIGTLQATRKNNRIEGYFRFFSEGMWSVREIVFEQQEGNLVQAQTADMVYSGDTARFQNKNALQFDARVFNPIDCGQLRFDAIPG
jgi:hypothetical protein